MARPLAAAVAAGTSRQMAAAVAAALRRGLVTPSPAATSLQADTAACVLGAASTVCGLLSERVGPHHSLADAHRRSLMPAALRRRVQQIVNSANAMRHCTPASLERLVADVSGWVDVVVVTEARCELCDGSLIGGGERLAEHGVGTLDPSKTSFGAEAREVGPGDLDDGVQAAAVLKDFTSLIMAYAQVQVLKEVAEKTDLAHISMKAWDHESLMNSFLGVCVDLIYEQGGRNDKE